MNKKYLTLIFTIISIILSVFCWNKLTLNYTFQGQAHGEYSINNYNAYNDTFRYILFIFLPLLTFFISYLKFHYNNTYNIKEVLFNNRDQLFLKKNSSNINIVLALIILVLIIEFLSINFDVFFNHLDHFHEGAFLTPSNNLLLTNKAWESSYIEFGFFGNFFPVFLWKIFNIQTIGITKLATLFLLLFNKILLVFISKEIAKNLLFSENIKILYFLILSVLLVSLSSYENLNASEFSTRSFLFLLYFLFFYNSLYKDNKFSFIFFILGIFSVTSVLWYLDIGAYINVITLFLLSYLLIRKEFKKLISLIIGIFFGWLVFIYFVPMNEIIAFITNSLSIYLTVDYVNGLIYPTPFLSGDSRSTRALIFIILAGILVIIANFNKDFKMNYQNKTFFVFIFIASLLVFKSGMMRSDAQHIKAASGFHLLIIYSIILYFLFNLILKNEQKFINLKINIFNNKNILSSQIILLFLFLSVFNTNLNNLKNIPTSLVKIKNLTYQSDENYLSLEFKDFIDHYKKLSFEDKCIQIMTNELSIPYLLKKPTCTKFYLMWFVSPEQVQKEFIEELKIYKPRLLLFNSKSSPYHFTEKNAPKLFNYVKANYSYYNQYKFWTFFKLN